MPVGTFKILVVPLNGGPALPLSAVNVVGPGEKLRYEPVKLPDDLKEKARVSVIIVPASDSTARHLEVLPPKPVKVPAEWLVPERASAVGVIFGPHGIDAKKVAVLVQKHPEIVTKLADYAEQSTRVEALVRTLSEYEQSPRTAGICSPCYKDSLHSTEWNYRRWITKVLPASRRSHSCERSLRK